MYTKQFILCYFLVNSSMRTIVLLSLLQYNMQQMLYTVCLDIYYFALDQGISPPNHGKRYLFHYFRSSQYSLRIFVSLSE